MIDQKKEYANKDRFAQKNRLIYFPFLFISLVFVIVYTFLNLFLVIKTEIVHIKQEVVNIWMPFFLPWIVVFTLLGKRIKLLKFPPWNSRISCIELYFLVAALAMVVPTLIAQSYVEKTSGKLSNVVSMNELQKSTSSRFYTIQDFTVGYGQLGTYTMFETIGRNAEKLSMNLYVTAPIIDKKSEQEQTIKVWFGLKYKKTIRSNLNSEQKANELRLFKRESIARFYHDCRKEPTYLRRVAYSDNSEGFERAIKTNRVYTEGNNTILEPVYESFAGRAKNKLKWTFLSYGIFALAFLFMVHSLDFNMAQLKTFNKPPNEKKRYWIQILSITIRDFWATPLLMGINILIFLLMVFTGLSYGFLSFQGGDLIAWGANYGPLTENGQWWRLFTNIFLHGSLMHLIGNLFGMFIMGIILEPLIGGIRLVFSYLVTGMLASLVSIWWHQEPAVSIGASGAIFGFVGVIGGLMVRKTMRRKIDKGIVYALGLYFGFNLLIGFVGNLDNAAHLGGLCIGIIVGFGIDLTLPKKKKTSPPRKSQSIKVL